MGSQGLNIGPSQTRAGWAHTAMAWLGRVTQVVEVTVCWAVGVLAGGVLLGWAPAGAAAGVVLHRLTGDDPSERPVADFFAVWRATFVRGNRAVWPATIAALVLAVNLWVMGRGHELWMLAALLGNGLLCLWLALSVGHLLTLLGSPETSTRPVGWLRRTALVMPLVSPAASLVWFVCVAALAVVAWVLPIVAVLAGPGYVALVTVWLSRRRLRQTGVVGQSDQEEDPRATTL